MAQIPIRVQPRSSRSEVLEHKEGVWRIALTSPPAEGKANQELIRLLAKLLKVAPSRIELASGGKSRDKRILIEDLSDEEAMERLTAHLSRK